MSYVWKYYQPFERCGSHTSSIFHCYRTVDSIRDCTCFLNADRFKPLNWLLTLYVWIMRGTPLLLQLIFVYYVLPSVGIVFDRLPAAILAFTLNYAAYFAEIFRGGILAIPKGQYEAAKMLKLSPFQTIRYIILPQVVKIVLPSIFNEIINLVKDSSLVYVLGVGDLLLESRTAANRDATLATDVCGRSYLSLSLWVLVTVACEKTRKEIQLIINKETFMLRN